MAIIRIHTGSDGKSHFEEIVPKLEPRGDKSESAELIPGSGIVIRRFEPTRSNPWHHAPGRYAVFTLSGAVDIEIGDGTVRRLGTGDILIAEDVTGQGHVTREVGPQARVSEARSISSGPSGPVPCERTAGVERPDGAQPPRSSARVPRGPSDPSHAPPSQRRRLRR